MKILWFTWKDRKNPEAGGAELVNEELAKRLVKEGHNVIFLVSGFPNTPVEESINGFKIIRLGNRYTVYWLAYRYYKRNLQGWADVVIEEINTVPFFSHLYLKGEKLVYLFYQLCREVWFYQTFFLFSFLGYYLAEPLYLRYLERTKRMVLTESESTKKDLGRYGFNASTVKVFPIGIAMKPIDNLHVLKKCIRPTVLSLGSIRRMKRIDHQIEAFEIAKQMIPDLQLKIAGDMESRRYSKKILTMIKHNRHKDDIEYVGRVSNDEKIELMRKCHVIVSTSIKEGWGLIVTEANSQGTPAIVYNTDGLRDSVQNDCTGLVTESNTPTSLAQKIVEMLKNHDRYQMFQANALEWSKKFNFENSYYCFTKILFNNVKV